jgi:hypothetical protein
LAWLNPEIDVENKLQFEFKKHLSAILKSMKMVLERPEKDD